MGVIRSLPFDFAIFHNDKLIMLIELNGQQHYYPYTFCGENIEKKRSNYEELYLRDKIKSEYCKNHKIPLLVIKYTMFHKKEELFQKQYDELISIS